MFTYYFLALLSLICLMVSVDVKHHVYWLIPALLSLISLMVSVDVKYHVYLLFPRTTRPHRNLKNVYPLSSRFAKSPGQSPSSPPSQSVSKSPSQSLSQSPIQSFSFVQLAFWLNLIHIQQVGLTVFYLPSSWLMFYCCLIVVWLL